MIASPIICLIHSPLVSAMTWQPVAEALRQRGISVVLPSLSDERGKGAPYWKQHAGSAVLSVDQASSGRQIILVGHSGAGPLLPAIRHALGSPVAAYLFVDAGLPQDNASRLQMMQVESPEWAREFGNFLQAGGRYPEWGDADLLEIVPHPALRQALVAGLRPRGLDFFMEPIPVFPGWPDAPCAYLHFSPPYEIHAASARQFGWPVRKIAAGHFHMLVDPAGVATAILELIKFLP